MAQATAEPAIKAYWQPGCTSCLRMKEFLNENKNWFNINWITVY